MAKPCFILPSSHPPPIRVATPMRRSMSAHRGSPRYSGQFFSQLGWRWVIHITAEVTRPRTSPVFRARTAHPGQSIWQSAARTLDVSTRKALALYDTFEQVRLWKLQAESATRHPILIPDSLRGSSAKIGTVQRILAWPLRKDDARKSRSVKQQRRFRR